MADPGGFEPPTSGYLRRDPGIPSGPIFKGSSKIINTLLKLKASGLREVTIRNISAQLKHIAKNVSNLDDPEEVKEFIANKKCAESYKVNLVKAYNYYAITNGIRWIKPKYRPINRSFKAPTTENVYKIIACAGPKYAVVFRLLAETGATPSELHQVTERDIDLERGAITIPGCKGHASRTVLLKPSLVSLLRNYLKKYGLPFPKPVRICRKWRFYRNRAAEKLNDPSLKQIRTYDLRHYFVTMTYYKTRDPIFTMQQAGHKKLETTLIYAHLIDHIDNKDDWVCKVAETVDEAVRLVEAGFEYVCDFNGVKIFRKRK